MNNQFKHMQKLAFGKPLDGDLTSLITESDLKNKIKEIISTSLGEVKKKKKNKKDQAPQDPSVELDMEIPAEDAPPSDLELDPNFADFQTQQDAPGAGMGADIAPEIKAIQDALQKAYANAKALGDEKLVTQIGNTITMLVRNQVLGGNQNNQNN